MLIKWKRISSEKKLGDLTRNSFWGLSTVTDDAWPTFQAETYLNLLKNNKALSLQSSLNMELEHMGCQVEVPPNIASAIRTGNFKLAARPFSAFVVPYFDPAKASSFIQMKLDLFQSEGDGIPKDIITHLS